MLGNKTTNAKGQAFQTPAPPKTLRPEKINRKATTTRKSVKSKITVAEPEPAEAGVLSIGEDDVADVEYCPPPPVELPDPPIEFGYDETFPEFKGRNFTRGWAEMYGEPRDENGMTAHERYIDELCTKYEKEADQKMLGDITNMSDGGSELDRQVNAMIAAGPRSQSKICSTLVDTARAKSAAAALSQTGLPYAAMKPTASSLQKSRKKPTFQIRSSENAPGPTNPSPMRHTAAEVVSKNTIGFPKAKTAPSIVPSKSKVVSKNPGIARPTTISQSDIHPADFRELYGEPPLGSEMWIRLRQHDLLWKELEDEDLDKAIAGAMHEVNLQLSCEDGHDEEGFQLSLPS